MPADLSAVSHRRRPLTALLAFVAVPYATLWVLAILVHRLGSRVSFDLRTPAGQLALLAIASPLAGAMLAAWLEDGARGIRALLARAFHWRFPWRWYLLAAAVPLLVIGASCAFSVFVLQAALPSRWFTARVPVEFMAVLLVYIGVGEEVGWRGYLLPRMVAWLGGLGGSVAVGVIWAAWHLPLFWMPGSFQYGTSPLAFVYLLVCWSMLMTWLAKGAQGSVLVAILFHGSVNFIAFALRYPGPYTFVFWGFAALAAVPFLPRPLLAKPQRP